MQQNLTRSIVALLVVVGGLAGCGGGSGKSSSGAPPPSSSPPPPSPSNPLPALTSIDPTTVIAGTAFVNMTVNGTDFTATSVVNWNGSPRATTFVSATQLTTQIQAADIVAAGTASVTV